MASAFICIFLLPQLVCGFVQWLLIKCTFYVLLVAIFKILSPSFKNAVVYSTCSTLPIFCLVLLLNSMAGRAKGTFCQLLPFYVPEPLAMQISVRLNIPCPFMLEGSRLLAQVFLTDPSLHGINTELKNASISSLVGWLLATKEKLTLMESHQSGVLKDRSWASKTHFQVYTQP